jgi:NAD(P)-dependent dehydrogenase (short-subunit alcohol dehydrogenase family)
VESESIFSLIDRTALVAGASRGIGLAIARAVAEAGAKTILASRDLKSLERHAETLRRRDCSVEAARLDIADPDSVRSLVDNSPEIDVLINVAGINIRKRFEQYTKQEYDHLLRTNLDGIVELTQKVGARMIARGKGGKIINIGSLTSLLGIPYLSVYAITKSGLAGLTRSLAAEWARYDIQVNCIVPGFILTDLNRDVFQAPEMREWLKGSEANSRLGAPEDVAPLAVFLSGRGSDYITGQLIAVDGGFTTTAVWPFEP